LFKKFIPHLNIDNVYDIDLAALKEAGVRGIITDLDNTLVGTNDPSAGPELIAWFGRVRSLGFQIVIVSNNKYARVAAFSEPLGIPFIPKAKKPTSAAFRQALKLMGLTAAQAVVIGDQLLTDVLGGNRMGLKTILVHPISLKGEAVTTRFNRRIERYIMNRLQRKGLIAWRDSR